MSFLDVFNCIYLTAAVGMSFALHGHHPELNGWGNVSRSLGWPVTIYEIANDLI